MEQEYDAVVLGTGLKECILSGLLSVHGYKVLHMDRNDYYGGESASLTLEQLFERFAPGTKPPAQYGGRGWYVDLVPKFILGRGMLVDVLRHTDVSKYMEFKTVNGSFVLRSKDKRICKVPSTDKEAFSTPLVKLGEKLHMKKILEFISSMHETTGSYDLDKMTMEELYKAFKIKDEVAQFMGHAMALWLDDEYLKRPARVTCERIRQYCMSVGSYASPYIYPQYGLGELPQAFARLSAIWGGTYMLRMPIDEILYHPDGKVRGIRSGSENVYCKWLVMDPTYFPDLVQPKGRVSRAICILDGPIAECVDQVKETYKGRGLPSAAQIIITGSQIGRRNDVYVTTQGPNHKTTPEGLNKPYCLGFVSTISEADTPDQDLKEGLDVLSRAGMRERFIFRTDLLCSKPGLHEKGIFISESYDATSHFETTVRDVLALYKAITGEEIDLKAEPRRPAVFEAEPLDAQTGAAPQ